MYFSISEFQINKRKRKIKRMCFLHDVKYVKQNKLSYPIYIDHMVKPNDLKPMHDERLGITFYAML